jgi:mannose-6-phosphate isomerase
MFYPLKFTPIFKEMIWGGKALREQLGKQTSSDKVGESWELSGVEHNISQITNGEYAGWDLQSWIAQNPAMALGKTIAEKHGNQFPLLIKFIDACDDLSIQVHPNDDMAWRYHQSAGKTEMWYVLNHTPNASLISGFSKQLSSETYAEYVQNGTLVDALQAHRVQRGDVFFIPAGRVHAIGKGILLLEIQQTSNLTYRIFDYNRKDAQGNPRELHTEKAQEAIDYTVCSDYKTHYETQKNAPGLLVSSSYFTVNLIDFDKPVKRNYTVFDSFVIYVCTQGSAQIEYALGKTETITMGETVLLPAAIKQVQLLPQTTSTSIVETFIE